MSSSSGFRPLHGEQPAANDGNARQHSMAANVQATDRERDQHRPAQSSSSTTHRRTESSSQRTREHRKEKVEVIETLVRRIRSPDQRTRPAPDRPKHVRAVSDANLYGSSRPKAKASKQARYVASTMESRGISSHPHERAPGIPNIHSTASLTGTYLITTWRVARIITRISRSGYRRRSSHGAYGTRRTIHPFC